MGIVAGVESLGSSEDRNQPGASAAWVVPSDPLHQYCNDWRSQPKSGNVVATA